ncbi:MAG: chalcone isomerase family protein, partial [Gammaproteobacteria bacterium]
MDKQHDNREGDAASRSKEMGASGSPRESGSPGESRGPGASGSPGERGGPGIRALRGSPPAASLLLAAVLAVASVASASAAEVDGVHFDDFVDLDGLRLNLNGAGLREVYIVKTWVAALYTPEPVHSPAALITGTGPRRIAVTLLA